MTPTSMLVKASLVLCAAALAHALAGRRLSAATRHLIWTLTVVSLLLLPMLSSALPGWTAIRLTAPGPAVIVPAGQFTVHSPRSTGITQIENAAPVAARDSSSTVAGDSTEFTRTVSMAAAIPWSVVLPTLHMVGVLLLLARLSAEQWSIQRLARRATEVSDPEWTRLFFECAERMDVRRPVRLLRSREGSMPMAFGIRHRTILIPAVADTWSEDRRGAVLLHELAHVARHDCLTQMMAAVACALYWVHPGVWWVARRLRVERELACDDRVLTAGAQARDYAGHLLDLAYSLGGHRPPALAVSMARPQQLEGRMVAVLDAARNRATPALRSRLAAVVILVAVLVPLAAATASFLPATSTAGALEPAPAFALRTPGASAGKQSAAAASDQESLPGTWELRPAREAGMVQIRLSDTDGSFTATVYIKSLEGIVPAEVLGAAGRVDVRFTVRRDAGSFAIEGIVNNRVGAGTFTFMPDPAFAAELAKRGFERPTATDQRLLARADIGYTFLDELMAQRYARPSLAELVRAAKHGVNLEYLREMGRLGYRLGRIEAVIEQRNHGVSPEYIRGLADQGLPRLSPEDLIRARNHGIDPDYIRGLKEVGHGSLDLEALVRLRNRGVDPDFIRQLDALGFKTLSLEALVDARNHGISPAYVQELRNLGYTLTLEELRNARNHGVDGDYIRGISALGYERLSLDALIRLRNQGIDPAYAKEMNSLGYGRLEIEALIELRNHGVTPERARSANARAGTRLSVEQLKAAAARGWR